MNLGLYWRNIAELQGTIGADVAILLAQILIFTPIIQHWDDLT